MDQDRFDDIAKSLAAGADRRSLLKRVAGGALGGLLALRGGLAAAQPGCRRERHPCEGNQDCCPGLVCLRTGAGSARRCAPPCGRNLACDSGRVREEACLCDGVCCQVNQVCAGQPSSRRCFTPGRSEAF